MSRFDNLLDSILTHVMAQEGIDECQAIEFIDNMANIKLVRLISTVMYEKGICPVPDKD